MMSMTDLLGSINTTILFHLMGALLAGALIGLERGFHGRPAGFRTHTLVCLASSLLMLLTLYQGEWLQAALGPEVTRTDPTRMAQGIMTGIGFLGAGVIFKDGLSVRGLTTAASIWITAAIGILVGVGFFFPAFVATLLTLGILSVFRWIENRMPTRSYAHHQVTFERGNIWTEQRVRALLKTHAFKVDGVSYRLTEDGDAFEYRMTISTSDKANYGRLASALAQEDAIREFKLLPRGD